jgi:hypothetical protein
MANTMTFNFNDNYSIDIDTENDVSLKTKIDTILHTITLTPSSDELLVQYISGERSQRDDENDAMEFDSWFLSIYSPDNERTSFIKNIGDVNVYVRAKNTITGNYEEFMMESTDAIGVFRDMIEFINASTE